MVGGPQFTTSSCRNGVWTHSHYKAELQKYLSISGISLIFLFFSDFFLGMVFWDVFQHIISAPSDISAGQMIFCLRFFIKYSLVSLKRADCLVWWVHLASGLVICGSCERSCDGNGRENWNLCEMLDSSYGSTFFLATGFHGLHVLIASWLCWCLCSMRKSVRYTKPKKIYAHSWTLVLCGTAILW